MRTKAMLLGFLISYVVMLVLTVWAVIKYREATGHE